MKELQEQTTTYYSECECGAEVEGTGYYHPEVGDLAGEPCKACGEEFNVIGWFWECDFCGYCHPEGECVEVEEDEE